MDLDDALLHDLLTEYRELTTQLADPAVYRHPAESRRVNERLIDLEPIAAAYT
ncbi:hypothetical protein ACFXHA_33350 [Nocardia sp. NPDC059240]|uniref:hypothetical protein n=1 Tax=Nocardia sp. NPDC059240 TaxID=3346786 RepID=UPI0036B83C42